MELLNTNKLCTILEVLTILEKRKVRLILTHYSEFHVTDHQTRFVKPYITQLCEKESESCYYRLCANIPYI